MAFLYSTKIKKVAAFIKLEFSILGMKFFFNDKANEFS